MTAVLSVAFGAKPFVQMNKVAVLSVFAPGTVLTNPMIVR
jgi:hypothetical protein